MTVSKVKTMMLRENAASFLWSHAWLKPGQEPTRFLPGSPELKRLMARNSGGVDAEGWKHITDDGMGIYRTFPEIKKALSAAGFAEGVDYKDGPDTEAIYI